MFKGWELTFLLHQFSSLLKLAMVRNQRYFFLFVLNPSNMQNRLVRLANRLCRVIRQGLGQTKEHSPEGEQHSYIIIHIFFLHIEYFPSSCSLHLNGVSGVTKILGVFNLTSNYFCTMIFSNKSFCHLLTARYFQTHKKYRVILKFQKYLQSYTDNKILFRGWTLV